MFDQAENSTRFRLLLEGWSVDSADDEGESSGVLKDVVRDSRGKVSKTDRLRNTFRGGVGGRVCARLNVSAISILVGLGQG